jgi:hypothetical protein
MPDVRFSITSDAGPAGNQGSRVVFVTALFGLGIPNMDDLCCPFGSKAPTVEFEGFFV